MARRRRCRDPRLGAGCGARAAELRFGLRGAPVHIGQNRQGDLYDLGSGTGNCSFPSAPADDLFVALGPDQYSNGAACGTYLDVTGPKGKVRVKVLDSCPECGTGHLDLSRTAFKKIGAEVDGIIPITYKTVTTATAPGPISVRVKEGSSQYWLAVLIDNHATQLKSVTVNGKTTHREDYNYWIIDSGAGSGPFKIKVTDVYGHSATVSGIKLSPEVTQKTTARLATGTSGAATTTAAKKKAAAPKPATTSASPSPAVSSAAPALESTEAAPDTAVATEEAPSEASVDLAASSCK
ncbi:expansin EXLX1 family cellulose-binding protein [Paractinoplanes durhamensis]|uniref:expansin EXLX1 family cellulose-binding protein n=1 Tax=Paractinoplanes durhamensis TaxID=113563 RepID=UPI00363187BA